MQDSLLLILPLHCTSSFSDRIHGVIAHNLLIVLLVVALRVIAIIVRCDKGERERVRIKFKRL